jgi:hypothetical protein
LTPVLSGGLLVCEGGISSRYQCEMGVGEILG